MKTKLAFAFAVAIASPLLVAPAFADPMKYHGSGHADAIYDESAIEKVMAGLDPDVGFLVRICMMNGHVSASLMNIEAGNLRYGAEHIAHPRTEIYDDLAKDLKARNLPDLLPVFLAAEAAAASGTVQEAKDAIGRVRDAIAAAGATVDLTRPEAEQIAVETAAILLRMAVVEYHEAYEYKKIANVVEYHDGAFFLQEAKRILDARKELHEKRNPEAYAKMRETLDLLSQAWPHSVPPEDSILPASKLQAYVSIIELRLNMLH